VRLFSENIEDKLLWQGLKKGDMNSFNKLFRKFYSELYYYGIKVNPDPEFVKEAIQEVFVRIWETRDRLGEAGNVKSYLIVSLRRMILTAKSKKAKKLQIEFTETDDYSFLYEVNEFEKHQDLSAELQTILLDSINSLTLRQRELVQLFFYHELSYSEIADVMKMSIQASRNLMYRTLTHLRETIGESELKIMKKMFVLFFLPVPEK
jgi:RNA polymerase sigma factor (sigma-70 family)